MQNKVGRKLGREQAARLYRLLAKVPSFLGRPEF